jgi:hypothetical protein
LKYTSTCGCARRRATHARRKAFSRGVEPFEPASIFLPIAVSPVERQAWGSIPVWSVLRRALALVAIGVAIGTAGALALARVMAGLLHQIHPTDAATFAGAAVLLAALAVVASRIPAWRATRVDPLIALRTE